MNEKILCINNKHPNFVYEHQKFYLTIGKFYKVMRKNINGYEVINDSHNSIFYNKELFQTIEEIRENKINKILEK